MYDGSRSLRTCGTINTLIVMSITKVVNMMRFQQLVIVVALLLVTQNSYANLLLVPDTYPSIFDACEVAVAGDTVGVMEGVYYEPYTWVKPGVTVIGLVPDCSMVQVFPQASSTLLVALSGVDQIVIENMELHGTQTNGILINLNDELVIQQCKLVIETDEYDETYCLHAYADMMVKKCSIFMDCHLSVPIKAYETCDILFEDCVIWAPYWGIESIPSGGEIEFRNNTILKPVCFYSSVTPEFSFVAVNNIIKRLDFFLYDGEFPETFEWRYNDFVDGMPNSNYGYQIGNFSLDPLFCDPGSYPNPTNGDYRLQPDSPCRLAGEYGETVGARQGICLPFSSVENLDEEDSLQMSISSIHPNPSRNSVTIHASVPVKAAARIEIIDVGGRRVWTSTTRETEGIRTFVWDGTMADGQNVPNGMYYIRLIGDGEIVTERICIMK
jgi:FlgD Ig-like domain